MAVSPCIVMDLAAICCSTFMFGAMAPRSVPSGIATRSAFSQRLSSNPAEVHAPNSLRASYISPSYSLLERIAPSALSFHFESVEIVFLVPSSNSTMRFALSLG